MTGEETLNVDELADALRTVRLWLRPEGQQNSAFRGTILHPEDAARDIFFAAQHQDEDGT
jgi:hypothetical protein